MANAKPNLPAEGPTQDDCGRLMLHLRTDYIPALRVEVDFYQVGAVGWGVKLEVVDDGLSGVDGKTVVNVWSAKTLFQRSLYISTADLYDLLMVAYRTIDRFFEGGEAFAPARRVK